MEADVVIVVCQQCHEVPVTLDHVVVHADDHSTVMLYAFECPRCGEMGSGGCRDLIRWLLEAGVPCRLLRPPDRPVRPTSPGDDVVAAFARWLDTDPDWSSS